MRRNLYRRFRNGAVYRMWRTADRNLAGAAHAERQDNARTGSARRSGERLKPGFCGELPQTAVNLGERQAKIKFTIDRGQKGVNVRCQTGQAGAVDIACEPG